MILHNIVQAGKTVGPVAAKFYELMTAPTTKDSTFSHLCLFYYIQLTFRQAAQKNKSYFLVAWPLRSSPPPPPSLA